MTTRTEKEFEALAKSIFEEIHNAEHFDVILDRVRSEDDFFSEVDNLEFAEEAALAHLALACIFWERLCHQYQVKDENSVKALLKIVMASYDSKESIEKAKRFSEYFCGDEESAEMQPAPAIANKLFKGFDRDPILKDETGEGKLRASFVRLVEALEAFRGELEVKFEDFMGQAL